MAVPVIDFSKLQGEDRAKTLSEINNGCQEWGFFQLINHGISDELLEGVKKVCSEFYKLEREQGFSNSKPVQLLDEFMRNSSSSNDKLDNVDWEDVIILTDHNQWPVKTPGFKETMKEYRAQVKKVAEKMMEVMDENLGLPKGYMNKAFNSGSEEDSNNNAFFGTKVSHYPPCPHPEKVPALRAHTDAGGIILLFQDEEVKGLQMLKDGEWIDVQPLPNAIVINTGDQIEVLSNGRYKSAWHRVLASPDGNRRSIASFYNPSLNATIAPATELLADKEEVEEQICYPKFLFADYMTVYAEQKFLPKEPRFQAVKAV